MSQVRHWPRAHATMTDTHLFPPPKKTISLKEGHSIRFIRKEASMRYFENGRLNGCFGYSSIALCGPRKNSSS